MVYGMAIFPPVFLVFLLNLLLWSRGMIFISGQHHPGLFLTG